MFHVEQLSMKSFFVVIFSFFLISCNKPDPNPELKDPIYLDLVAATSAVTNQLENEKKTLADHRKTLREVALQTGQNKYAEKRVRESAERINKLEQEKQYLELKVEAHKRAAKKSYLQAFKNGEAWPDEKEWNSYKTEKKLQSASKTWSAKSRIEEFNNNSNKNGPIAAPAGH